MTLSNGYKLHGGLADCTTSPRPGTLQFPVSVF